MTKKDLETEFSQLKSSFRVLQTQFNILNDKHEVLEKKYDEAVSKKSQVFKCSICDENFNSSENLKKHMGSQRQQFGLFNVMSVRECLMRNGNSQPIANNM